MYRAGEHRHERPYCVTGQTHDESITLTKWKQWRGADAVKVERFAGRIIRNATTALTAFEAGEIDACIVQACIPPDDIERLRNSDAYLPAPGLVTRFLALNLKERAGPESTPNGVRAPTGRRSSRT